MKCPSCHFDQPEERLDCECCGLVFSKWRERHSPPPDQDESSDPLETSIPQAVIGRESDLISTSQGRIYHRLAALEFQREPAGEVVYFPWGSFGKGYQIPDPSTHKKCERLEISFTCLHSPLLVVFSLVTILVWLYFPGGKLNGMLIFTSYIAVAYGTFGWFSHRLVSTLTPWPLKFDQRQYLKSFSQALKFRFLFDLEILSFIMLLAAIWVWLTGQFLVAINNGVLVERSWVILSAALWSGCTYFYYFYKKD